MQVRSDLASFRFVRGSIRGSMLAILLLSGVVAVLVGVVGLNQTGRVSSEATQMFEQDLRPTQDVGDIREKFWTMRWTSLSNLTADTPENAAKYATMTDQALADLQKAVDTLHTRTLSAPEQAALANLTNAWQKYLDLRQESSALKKAGKITEWQNFRSKILNPQASAVTEAIAGMITAIERASSARVAHAEQVRTSAYQQIIAILVIGVGVCLVAGLILSRALSGRIHQLRDVLTRAAAGDLTVKVERMPDAHEVGEMNDAVAGLIERMGTALHSIAGASGALDARARDLRASSDSLLQASADTSRQVSSIDSNVSDVSESVHTVASGAEQMGASIREIASNAATAAEVARQAVEVTQSAEGLMTHLGESSALIGNVIKVITAIAEQTNLLALNATIEAARAGEAGKGFAVVASEVKDLAQETARATEEIGSRVEAIQSDTRSAIESISGISEVIERISSYQGVIASAVEEQNATTASMSEALQRAAVSSAQIRDSMTQVVETSTSNQTAAETTQESAAEVESMADQLSVVTSAFHF